LDIKREPTKKRGKYFAIAGGVVVLIGTTLALSNLESRPPSVERATLWIDSVQRGQMVRAVRAPGTLVPEHIRYVVAVTSGRVEALPIRPGTTVQPSTPLLELSNPDVQLEMLNAQRQLADAEANLVSLRTNLETQRLNQASTVAQVRTQYAAAMRDAAVMEALDKKKLASENELTKAQDLAKELKERIAIEEQRLKVQTDAIKGQLALAAQNVEKLRAIQKFQEERVASMRVPAGEGGQLLSLGNGQQQLELGQWVLAGQTLATIAQPGRLKAVLRVPETQAKDIMVGQKAEVDTRNGIIQGHVIRADPTSVNGSVTVEVALDGELPKGARADLSVDANIEIERLHDVLFVGRPAYGQPESTVGIFRLDPDGKNATRVNVKLGRASVSTIEVVSGLNKGDRVIISDMSQWDNVQRVRLQ
jgi:multidrug resistance efflux pump